MYTDVLFHMTMEYNIYENCARLIVSVAWVAHIVIYLLIDPPLSPFLNEVFVKLDDVWGLLDLLVLSFTFFPKFYTYAMQFTFVYYSQHINLLLNQVFWVLLHLHFSASTFSLL